MPRALRHALVRDGQPGAWTRCCGLPGDSKTLDVPDCLSRLITRPSPPDEIELGRLKSTLRADDATAEELEKDTLEDKVRTDVPRKRSSLDPPWAWF